MFLRTVKAAGGGGTQHEYLRLVESYRDDGKTKQRVVCHLGRKDVLAPHLESLIRVLRGEPVERPIRVGDVQATDAWDWGPLLVARALWRELGIEATLDRGGGRGKPEGVALADRAFVLVANRLCAPSSEHGLARWLETDFVCDRRGQQFVAEWREEAERRASRLPRVRVAWRQLKTWYRTLDQLQARKRDLERALFLTLRDLFSLKVDLVFYDLTSTYFEGQGPADLARHGYSRDGKPRNRQVLVGVVMVQGWPIAHHVFGGNLRDSTTVEEVLDDLETRFGVGRIVFVGDRGMVTWDNLQRLQARGQGYVVGLERRRRPEVDAYLRRVDETQWVDCPAGITASEKAVAPKTQVQEVESGRPGVRVFVVRSDDRLAFERARRVEGMAKVRTALEALQRRIANGQLKAPDKVGAAAARILSRHHGSRYFDWAYTDGRFRFFESENLAREQALEGTYLIQTEEPHLTPLDAVAIYKELSEVERSFAHLKDVIELRPIYHQTPERVKAHVFVASLAFLLHRALEKKLKAAGLDVSATDALQALRTVRVVQIDLGHGRTKRSTTRGSARAARILAALAITDLDPPAPPTRAQTLM
jgi:transposase